MATWTRRVVVTVVAVMIAFYAFADTSYSENSLDGVYLCTPEFVELGKCSAVDDEYYRRVSVITHGGYSFGIMDITLEGQHKKAISVLGGMSIGFSNHLSLMLEQYPDIDTLVVSSAGGAAQEAQHTYDLVKDRGLTVVIPPRRACLSSCADGFIAADDFRIYGYLGFHSIWYRLNNTRPLVDLPTMNDTLSLIVNELQILHTVAILNRYNKGLPVDFSMYVAEQEGNFVIFNSHQALHRYVQSHDLRNTKVINETDLGVSLDNQQQTEDYIYHRNTGVINVY